ncbi:MAG: glycosyltransferase family 39 protein [Phycisphaerae bacterium]|nr:glycosyltransferase family 39 protein [Phycisphaerae bacterium]
MNSTPANRPSWIRPAIIALALVSCFGGLFGGPALGDHEAIVAQCARDMRLTGNWVVPRFLDAEFVRKPPLSYWLVAAASYVLPPDPGSGLPVTDAAARLPSGLAGFATVMMVWWAGSLMLGRRAGRLAAVMAASAVVLLLYAANATCEMLLIFFCTWAGVEFWLGVTHASRRGRFLHMMLFYAALGLAMLAKGPAPIALVAAPLAFWWYAERPLRLIARGGFRAVPTAFRSFVRGLVPQTVRVFTRLWFLPGIFLFAAMFVPWMLEVARRNPHVDELWNWQYVQRAQGDYEDTRVRGFFYYLPVVGGYLAPWVFLVFEAFAAPWMRRYARWRRPLLYVGLWAGLGVLAMSAMTFKKPYYIAPAIPALVLLMSVVALRVLQYRVRQPRRAWVLWGIGAALSAVAVTAGSAWLRHEAPQAWGMLVAIAGAGMLVLLGAGVAFVRGRPGPAFALVAGTSVALFLVVWYACAPHVDNVADVAALDDTLDAAGVPDDARLLWADQRPDARLDFYFQRRSGYMIDPYEIVSRMVDRTKGKDLLREMVLERAAGLLGGNEPVYLILTREHFGQWQAAASVDARLVGVVDSDAFTQKNDWVIITNAPASDPAGPTTPSDHPSSSAPLPSARTAPRVPPPVAS